MKTERVLGKRTYTASVKEIRKLQAARDVLRDFEDISSGDVQHYVSQGVSCISCCLIALGVEEAPPVTEPHPGRKEDPFVAPCGKT